ncbi:hypothetical protein MP228_011183 [Amoeboaphelidium protococcarum]|nr:hypothetical protein MP228_011183 [Amoeboaphelidium protococcarum]
MSHYPAGHQQQPMYAPAQMNTSEGSSVPPPIRSRNNSRQNLTGNNDNDYMIQSSFAHEAKDGDYQQDTASTCYGAMISSFGSVLGVLGSIPCCFCFPNPYKSINQGTVGLFTAFGRYRRTVNAGLVYYNVMTESVTVVDVRMQTVDIPHQQTITRDNVSVTVDSVLFYSIQNPYKSVFEVANVRTALIERTLTTLRAVIGLHDLQEAITNRETVAREIYKNITGIAAQWGVKVESILIKDIGFSQELQDSLSAAAKAKRLGASKIVQAEAEVQAAMLMKKTAMLLSNPAAQQIRYLETMKAMAAENNTKIIFMPPSFGNQRQMTEKELKDLEEIEDETSKSMGNMQKAALNDVIAKF